MSEPSIRPLVEDDLDALARVRQVAFLDTTDYDDPAHRQRMLSRMRHMSGVFLDDELVAAGAMLPFNMFYEGENIRVAGLASVVSAGEHRRKGHVRMLLARLLSDAHQNGTAWCLEYPFDSRYYARFGWQSIPSGMVVEAPIEWFDIEERTFEARRLDRESDETVESLREIWDAWAPRYNFSMTRDGNARPDWELVVQGSPWESERNRATRFTFEVDDAFAVLLIRRREEDRATVATVFDWAFASSEGRGALFAFLASLRGQVDRVRIQFPVDDPLLLELTPHLIGLRHPLQARIVDVERALGPVAENLRTELTFAVRDEFCTWNDATFRVGSDGVDRVEGSPDVEVDIRALALALSGARVDTSLLVGGGAADVLEGIANTVRNRPYMPLSDYF